MSSSISKSISGLGFIVLLHAAYSAHQFKLLVPEAALWPPADVVAECIAACFLVLFGLLLSLKLNPVRITSDMMNKHFEETMSRVDFVNLNNRMNAKNSILNPKNAQQMRKKL